MKKSLVAMAVGLTLSAGVAHAGGILDSYRLLNPSTNTFVTVDTNDWSSSGSGAIENLTLGAGIPLGQDFTFDYQARLAGVTLGGAPVALPGLNTAYEYTIVTKFVNDTIDAIAPGAAGIGDVGIFSTLGGDFRIYVTHGALPPLPATGGVFSDTPTGVGFDDGVLVASGIIEAGQLSSFLPTGIGTGIGSAIIQGIVQTINPTYLDPISAGLELPLFDIRFEGTENLPPLDSDTTGFFIGGAGAPFGDVPIDGNDIVLKVDGSTKFSVVPEPSSVLLLGVGLLGLAGYARKKIKS